MIWGELWVSELDTNVSLTDLFSKANSKLGVPVITVADWLFFFTLVI